MREERTEQFISNKEEKVILKILKLLIGQNCDIDESINIIHGVQTHLIITLKEKMKRIKEEGRK